jgi:gamma-glutamyltranspeptidase/glutathione hydrolase
VHLLAEACKLAYADRLAFAADPNFLPSRVGELLEKRYAARRAGAIDYERAASSVGPGRLHEGETTYLTVADGEGRMVSLIQSVSAAFGSGMVAGDTGIVLNNRVGRGFSLDPGHPNRFEPGKRTMHTLNCWLMADPAGTMIAAGGTPGGDGQPQWNLQVLTALIDGGADVQAAIETPRWTVWPGTDPVTLPNPYELRIERQAGDELIAAMTARGHDVRVQPAWMGGGAAQAIVRDPVTGVMAGGSDPRAEGSAAGF